MEEATSTPKLDQASGASPLKKLRKKFNRLTRGGSFKSRSGYKSHQTDGSSDSRSLQEMSTVDGSDQTIGALVHQDSMQSAASSVMYADGGDSSAYSSFDDELSDSFPMHEENGMTAAANGNDLASEKRLMEPTDALVAEEEDQVSQPMKLELTLISGTDLVAKDRNGFSDPYIKVKYKARTVHKTKVISKCLNPVWEETCILQLVELGQLITLRVYDRDTFTEDDFMGKACIDLSQLPTDRPVDLTLALIEDEDIEQEDVVDTRNDIDLGQLNVRCMLHSHSPVVDPTASHEPKSRGSHWSRHRALVTFSDMVSSSIESLMNHIIKDADSTAASEWDYIVKIVLMEGTNLLAMDDNGLSDPYVRFKLHNDKYKTKVKNKTLNPKWQEAFCMHLYEGKSWELDIRVFDYNIAGRADFMGRASLDLTALEVDHTHDITVKLVDQIGSLRLLVTITGAVSSTDHEVSSTARDEITRRYGLLHSLTNFKDVGWLQVKVVRAHGLSSKDWDGKSDPFCTVELVNTMLQTHTSYNTLNPEWNRVFTIPVKDIHSVLEVTVYDEDKDMKREFIGKVAIPLIMVENGVQKWYGLKDRKLFNRVKGEVLLELDMVFNHVKAAIRTFNPREEPTLKEESKFKISLFKRNVNRVRTVGASIVSARDFWQSLINWDYPSKTITAFVAFMVAVWNFELYMLPLTLIMLFMWNLVVREIKGGAGDDMVQFFGGRRAKEADLEEDEGDEEGDDKENKKSFRDYIDAVKSICCTIQEMLGKIADLAEAVKNSVNWTVPWLSALAVVALSIIMFILYMIPLRYIVLIWGVNKFTKKLRKPNYIPNNEVLDYLSRVPSDIDKIIYKEIRADPGRGRSNSPQPKGRKAVKSK